MRKFRPYKALASINAASPAAASELFAKCAASPAWARRMVDARPFAMLEDLYSAAERAWFAVAAGESLKDVETYTSVEQRLGSLLEELGRAEELEAKASGAEARA